MADIAQMPKPEHRRRRWCVELRLRADPGVQEIRYVDNALLGSADDGWVKFKLADGRIEMFATDVVLRVWEEQGA